MERYNLIKELAKYIPVSIWFNFLQSLPKWSDEKLEKLLQEYKK